MPQLVIRVAASVDRSLSVAYRPLVEAAARAARSTEQSAQKGAAGTASATKKGLDQAEKNYRRMAAEVEKWSRQATRETEKQAAAQTRATEKEARAQVKAVERAAKDKVRAEKAAAKEIASEHAKEQRFNDRMIITGARMARRGLDRGAGAGMGAVSSLGRGAIGIAGSVARGAGVDLDVASHVRRSMELERRAVDLSNAGYMPGKAGPAGTRQNAKAIERETRDVGSYAGYDPTQAMEGLQKFVAKTGDLQGGREILKDMAKYSRASGAELEDMVDAAGDISNALGETENKSEKIRSVMRAIAAQGKEGAVEIKDLATQMAKLAAASSQFTGDPTEVMAQMGALTQMARAKGGSASATSAATSVSAFTNTFSKGARLDAFQNFGVDVHGPGGKVDVKQAIFGAIKAASSAQHGGMANFDRNMGKMFMDVQARRATKGFETVFKEGGGGEAGLKKAMEAFDALSSATMRETEIAESFRRAMDTSEARVQGFNNQINESATALKDGLAPAAQALAPLFVQLATSSAGWLATITGTKERDDQRKSFGVESNAINVTTALRRAQEKIGPDGKGIVSETETRGAAQAKKDIEGAILRKQQQVEGRREGLRALGNVKGVDMAALGEEEGLRKLSEGDGAASEVAKQQISDKQQLSRMREELTDLTREINSVNDKYMNGMLTVLEGASSGTALRVEVVNRPISDATGDAHKP